jgi:hypothetical protein
MGEEGKACVGDVVWSGVYAGWASSTLCGDDETISTSSVKNPDSISWRKCFEFIFLLS